MTRLRKIKNEHRGRNLKSTSSNSSGSSNVPLITSSINLNRNKFEKRTNNQILNYQTIINQLNRNQHQLNSIEQTTALAWKPIINELINSKRSTSRTSSQSIRSRSKFKNRFLKPPKDVKPNKLFNNRNEFYRNQPIKSDHFNKSNSSDNEQKLNSTFSTNDESSIDKNVPNDILYSINQIYGFEVPNFETNKFEKIKTKSNIIETNEFDFNHNQFNEIDNLSSEDSNDEIYGICSNSTQISSKSNNSNLSNKFIDLNSDLSVDQYKLNINQKKIRKNDKISEEIESIYELNQQPQMIISKSIELNSELESDIPDQIKFNQPKINGHTNRSNRFLKKDNSIKQRQTLNQSNILDNELINPVNRLLDLFEPYEYQNNTIDENEILNLNNHFHHLNPKVTFSNLTNQLNKEQYHDIKTKQNELNSQHFKQFNYSSKIDQLKKQNLNNYSHRKDNQSMSSTINHLPIPKSNQFLKIDHSNIKNQPNFLLHPFSLQHHNLNHHNQHDLTFYKQADTQRHFLVSFKHYYPESSKWAFIVLTCVCLIHSLQFVFQIEHLFIIDSSVYFNSSLTLSVFTGSLSSCISLFLSPFVISFCQFNSSRLIAFLGSIFSALALLFTSFATLPGQLLISFGIFYAIGSSLLRESSSIILSKYYKRRRVLVEMIIIFSCYLSYAFLPIILSYVINTRIWRNGFQMYATLFLICFLTCIFMRPASLYHLYNRKNFSEDQNNNRVLRFFKCIKIREQAIFILVLLNLFPKYSLYHPQRKAILHLKSLQKRSKLKRKQQQTKSEGKHLFGSINLIATKIQNIFKCVDCSPLNSRTIQLLMCSICLISFGIFHPIFVLCPTFYIHYHFNITSLYYLQLIFGLSACISPILVYILFNRPLNSRTNNDKLTANRNDKNLIEPNLQQPKNQETKSIFRKVTKFFDPLFLIKFSSLAISLLQFYLIQLDLSQKLTINLAITYGLYAFFFALLFSSLKILIIRKVRARSICLLYSWFELIMSLPLLIGTTISAFLNDTFGNNVAGTYFSAISCLCGFLTLFSIDIHRRMNRKHINSYLNQTDQKEKNSKLRLIKRLVKNDNQNNIELIRQSNDNKLNKTTRNDSTQSKRKLFKNYSQNNDELMKIKFLNSRQEQHPTKYQRIDQNLIQRNNSFPQLSLNENNQLKGDQNYLPIQLFNNPLTTYPTNQSTNNHFLLGSRHSLDTLLNKFGNNETTVFNNQLLNFTSLPEITNILTNLRCTNLDKLNFNKINNLPISNYTTAATKSIKQSNYTNNSKEKIIYLNKNDNSMCNDKRRNSQLTKISQIDEIDYLEHKRPKLIRTKKTENNSGSESSLTDPDSDLEIDVDCNQIKNDKQVLEDLNELINESLNDDNLNNLDKLFSKYDSESDDQLKPKNKLNNQIASKDLEIKNNLRKFSQNTRKQQTKQLNNEIQLSGQLICDDYEDLVSSLLNSKINEKHQDNCIMNKLIQDILKEITIKSLQLGDQFPNQTTSNQSSTNQQHNENRHFNHKIHHDHFNPSLKLKESLLANRCLNCESQL